MTEPVCCVCGKEATYSEVILWHSKGVAEVMTEFNPEKAVQETQHFCPTHKHLFNTKELKNILKTKSNIKKYLDCNGKEVNEFDVLFDVAKPDGPWNYLVCVLNLQKDAYEIRDLNNWNTGLGRVGEDGRLIGLENIGSAVSQEVIDRLGPYLDSALEDIIDRLDSEGLAVGAFIRASYKYITEG